MADVQVAVDWSTMVPIGPMVSVAHVGGVAAGRRLTRGSRRAGRFAHRWQRQRHGQRQTEQPKAKYAGHGFASFVPDTKHPLPCSIKGTPRLGGGCALEMSEGWEPQRHRDTETQRRERNKRRSEGTRFAGCLFSSLCLRASVVES